MRVAVTEFGIGNIASVVNGIQRTGVVPTIVRNGEELRRLCPTHIIMPGVGAIGVALNNFRARGFAPAIEELAIENRVPLLGICVGMQMLGGPCEEFGSHQGLGWISGSVRRLAEPGSELRLPHVGWNTLNVIDPNDPVFRHLQGQDVYFVHSYVLDCPMDYVAATATYGHPFTAAVRRDNVIGVQFHPEKSSTLGAALFRAFLDNP